MIITDFLTYNIYSSIIPIAVNGSKILKDRIPMRQAREDERLRQNGYSQRKKGSEGMGGGDGRNGEEDHEEEMIKKTRGKAVSRVRTLYPEEAFS